tara:strand:- start:2706 stop:3143 length:438 start_codon:yes stop_codon:yes gene_type:complete
MAYIISTSDNFVYKIAANDTHKDNMNCLFPPYKTFDITDADFIKIKSGIAQATISDNAVTINDLADYIIENANELDEYLKSKVKYINYFLNNKNNSSNALYTDIQNYKNYLESFDINSLTYPLNKCWEKYCEDNNITYFNILQIP